ncbi:Uu.00g101610.m01.CDS01 [Anthostomella pinea]|uniref:Uu.00g101610.m01.CDS01 n=1 Tax=Anthostomella pinea TaxID=933095 RepID=A0AAI8VE72_9PEZI|nr:Uu.00g101610.m01.CDS01 [Anthostomella pinea]
MAAKTKVSNPLSGMHTAGIFSDMSVDGPEIGTLVLIIDRAKNLPNRKTIGKQDPYCAARLGKEAKKTTTDIRGGQTPKWDQELRFTVHDSPDYYQLKLSVFNDDKKTDLIGETWMDLRDIVVQGGGQSDQWHTLNCKGKYAGEVRIEVTYYDSRPKPEKLAAKPRPVASNPELHSPGATLGPRPQVKRRPLPSDPVTGQAPSPSVSERVHNPPRPQPNPPGAFVSSQSPLQAVEYGTPPTHRHGSHPDHYSPAPSAGSLFGTPQHRGDVRNDHFPNYDHDPFVQAASPHGARSYNSPSSPAHLLHQPSEDDDRPPPPPAHRVSHSSGNLHEMMHRGSVDMHKATPPMRHDVLRNEAHRNSVSSPSSSYPGRPAYRPYDSAPDLQNAAPYHEADAAHSSTPRHHSNDSAYDPHHRSMQPTVEDVPESWTPPNARARGGSRVSQYDEREYNQVPSPAPLNLGGRGSAASESHSLVQLQTRYDTNGYTASPSPVSPADYSHALTHVSRSHGNLVDHYSNHASELDSNPTHSSTDYDLPPVPPSLVPGVDPALARQISDRFQQERHHERRYTQPAPVSAPTRGRQHSEPASHEIVQYSPHVHHSSNSRSYDRRPISYSTGPSTPAGSAQISTSQRVSPKPSANHTIRRKSVSPAPPPADARRLSGVPFGPDSYDALNPSVASSKEVRNSSEYTNADGKIVTADGREIDPSDHLPMDTWAPEPEPKKPTPSTETRSRPTPAGAQPMPPSGRRQLRIATRPQSMVVTPSAYTTSEAVPSPPASTGRNRLQKKMPRASALPAPISAGSSPLGLATPHQRNSTPPRALVRASTFDYENHGPPFESGPGYSRAGYGSAPPVPAKVPMMSGSLVPASGAPRGGDEWALMEEMSRIDIGSGRSRRHGRY